MQDRYTLVRELGRGGMATVYLAQDLRHDRPIALKVLHPLLAQALGPERFLREIKLAASLQHPHILTVHDSGDTAGQLWFTMPFVEGESLRDRLTRERQLTLQDALHIARDICSALSYAHTHGVVHRDIKPENILLTGEYALVADFGIARAITDTSSERLTQTGLAVGTPNYMSPEQACGERGLDGRSDIYSLGCVLYEMLAGEPPYTGPTAQAVIARQLSQPVPPLHAARETVPPAIEAAVVKALARDSADRFATVREFGAALASSGASTVEWKNRDPVIGSNRWAPGVGRKSGQLVLGLLIAAALAGGGSLLWDRKRASEGKARVAPVGTVADSNSVAVLYLENLSRDSLDAYLADGLTEEVTSRLGKIERLKVKSRGAVRRLRENSLRDPSALGRELNVHYLVEGSVRRAGLRIRVSIRLISASDGFEVWGNEYDTESRDVLEVQDSIARQVAATIGGHLTASEQVVLDQKATKDPEAYDHYLRGNYLMSRRTPRSVREAIEEFGSALRLDSGFVAARARAAYGYALFADWGWPYPGLTAESVMKAGLTAAQTALRQDSTSADAWMAQAYLLELEHPRTLEGVAPAFERAIALDSSNAEAFYQYGQGLMSGGQDSAALAAYRRASALDPSWSAPMLSSGGLMLIRRQLSEALGWLNAAITADSSSSYAYAVRALVNEAMGRLDATREDAETALRLATGYRIPAYSVLALASARAGDVTAAEAWIGKALKDLEGKPSISPTDASFIGAALTKMTRTEDALRLLERTRPRGGWLWFYLQKPTFDPIRHEPRFQQILAASRPPGAVDRH